APCPPPNSPGSAPAARCRTRPCSAPPPRRPASSRSPPCATRSPRASPAGWPKRTPRPPPTPSSTSAAPATASMRTTPATGPSPPRIRPRRCPVPAPDVSARRGITPANAPAAKAGPAAAQQAAPGRAVEGSRAVAETVARCRPQVVPAYPISPQTHIVEALSALVRQGALAPCEFVNVASEFGAMSLSIGASAAGARTYTATPSQGLLFMAEALYNAAGLGLPIVLTVANRALGAPINIWNDQSDSLSQRDSGWIQLYARDNQAACDLHPIAFRLAEELSVPVMVCMDGFVLTHAVERIAVPEQEAVDAFLPPYRPQQI